ncbi:hypothetical protein HHI36_006356 [Cryptolaemus montrouzieri]|uniref:Transposase n=1 Tax=Cryptolaemus montrouzieri TaxID=559131 RepID=A0ABD2NWU1_9CUCU
MVIYVVHNFGYRNYDDVISLVQYTCTYYIELFATKLPSVVRLPAYHPNIHPIELVWALLLGYVATSNAFEHGMVQCGQDVGEDLPRSGQPSTSSTEVNNDKVEEMILQNFCCARPSRIWRNFF